MDNGRWARLVGASAVLLFAGAGLVGCGDDSEGTSGPGTTGGIAPTTFEIGAGVNDPADSTIAVLAFMPASVTVPVDTPITWTWSGAEPHSVTLLAPGVELPPPGSDPSWFAPEPPAGPYDGSTTVNSGLQPLGAPAAPFELSFAKEGTYQYFCVIHPTMVGTVDVVAAGADADTPAEVAARGAAERAEWLAEGQAAKKAFASSAAVSTANPDGSRNWRVEMGTSTLHTDILAFQPTPSAVKAGDSVTFVNNSTAPHTASFFGVGAEPIQDPTDPKVDPPAPGPSPQVLSSKGFLNTGLLPPDAPPGGGPPEAVRSFTFTVPDAGTYSYVCILHAPSAMVGTIVAR